MRPPIIKIEVQEEINNFEQNIFERLLPCFDEIEQEAKKKKKDFLERKFKNFDPDFDDEGIIEEDAYFVEVNHVLLEEELKNNFIKSSLVSLYHLLECQNQRIFACYKYNDLQKVLLSEQKYDMSKCSNWNILDNELRVLANAIKHGSSSKAMQNVPKKYLDKNGNILLTGNDLKNFIEVLKNYWNKAL